MRPIVRGSLDGSVSVRMEREVAGEVGYEVDVIRSARGIWRVETDGPQPEIDYNTEFDGLIRIAEDAVANYDGPPDDPDAWSGGFCANH